MEGLNVRERQIYETMGDKWVTLDTLHTSRPLMNRLHSMRLVETRVNPAFRDPMERFGHSNVDPRLSVQYRKIENV